MPITIEQIDEWRGEPSETRTIEFKAAKNDYARQSLYEYCAALANEGGGHFILGIQNKPIPRPVVGSHAFRNIVSIETEIFNNVGFRVDAEEINHPDGRVVVFTIPGRPMGMAYRCDGRYLMRCGEEIRVMSDEVLRGIHDEGKPDWLAEPSITDLTDEGVVELLETQKFFELMKLPYPVGRDGVIERLLSWQLIRKERNNLYSILRIGGILLAKDLSRFSELDRKAPRVIVYTGISKIDTKLDITGSKGYAVSFQALVSFVMAQLPQNEVIEDALRKEVKLLPELAIRELLANALIHQDMNIGGRSILVEVYRNRVEISNPGNLAVPANRIIDGQVSRNEQLADLMRKLGICEEKGSGADKVVNCAEVYQLPAPNWREGFYRSIVTIYGHKSFEAMDMDEKVRACYQHCALRYVTGEYMTNQSLRERFRLAESKSGVVTRIISAAIEAGKVKPEEIGGSRKYAKYIPFWA